MFVTLINHHDKEIYTVKHCINVSHICSVQIRNIEHSDGDIIIIATTRGQDIRSRYPDAFTGVALKLNP